MTHWIFKAQLRAHFSFARFFSSFVFCISHFRFSPFPLVFPAPLSCFVSHRVAAVKYAQWAKMQCEQATDSRQNTAPAEYYTKQKDPNRAQHAYRLCQTLTEGRKVGRDEWTERVWKLRTFVEHPAWNTRRNNQKRLILRTRGLEVMLYSMAIFTHFHHSLVREFVAVSWAIFNAESVSLSACITKCA